MATLMGTPYERGKSDVIVSRKVDAPIAEGLIVADAGNGKVEAFDAGKTPFGVMGQNEIVGCSVVLSGLKVYVQADDDCVPTVGAQVFVTSDGKVTHDDDDGGNTGLKAEFAEGALKNNGVIDNTAVKSLTAKCVAINFVGGF